MTALHILMHVSLARRSKRLNRKQLTLLHFCIISILDYGYRLASMDLVRADGVTIKISDGFD